MTILVDCQTYSIRPYIITCAQRTNRTDPIHTIEWIT